MRLNLSSSGEFKGYVDDRVEDVNPGTQQFQASGKVEESDKEQAAYGGKDEVQTRVRVD